MEFKHQFIQSRDIRDFRPLIDTMLKDFGAIFLHTVLQWCKLAHDDYEPKSQYWEVWLLQEYKVNKHGMKTDVRTIGICGLYSLEPGSKKNLWLGWLGLIPSRRNKGLGKQIMAHLYREALIEDCEKIYSYVDQKGKPLSFYKRQGFTILGTVKEFLETTKMKQIDGSAFESPKDWVIMKRIR